MVYGTPSSSVAATFTGRCVQLPLFCASPTRSQLFSRDVCRTKLNTNLVTPATRSSFLLLRKLRKRQIRCSLTRLTGDASHKVLPALATGDQWAHFWGETEIQRVGKAFEVVSIAFLGLWACYFTSFFLGVGAMSVIGGSFLFYWLIAPNIIAYRRNRVLRGRIAPFPGAKGNHMAIFSARVVSATEEYHPITGQPVFLRLVVEDEDGRALKFRTRTRAEYTRVRPGMVTEAVLVSLDERFEEIIGVSDTFVPGANVWVGEYPYLDKVVMRRLLASRDSKIRRGRMSGSFRESKVDEELDPVAYSEAWTERDDAKTFPAREPFPPSLGDSANIDSLGRSLSDEDGEGEPQYEGYRSTGFSAEDSYAGGVIGAGHRRWERVTAQPRPRRRRPPMSMQFKGEDDAYTDRRTREKRFEREEGTSSGGGSLGRDSRMTTRREQDAK